MTTIELPAGRSILRVRHGVRRAAPWLAVVAVLALAAWLCDGRLLTADDSWLLTIGEKWLAGAVPYVDVIETNPPASILLYMPAVLAGHWLGLRAETWLVVMTLALVCASLSLGGLILRRAGLWNRALAPWLGAAALFVLLVLPGDVFAQREHMAAALVLPVLAAYAAFLAGRRPGVLLQLAAGLAGGICVAIKPHFGSALALPLAFVVLQQPRAVAAYARVLLAPVNLVIALIVLLYGVSVPLFFPAFLHDIMPLVMAVYLPVRTALPIVLASAVYCWALPYLLLRLVEPGTRRNPLSLLMFLSSAGFALALVVQGKAWPYHLYPVLALALLALAGSLIHRLASGPGVLRSPRLVLALAGTLALSAYALDYFARHIQPVEVIAEVRKLGLKKPRILTVSSVIALGHPLVREVDGEWGDRLHSHWITTNVDYLRQVRSDLSAEQQGQLDHYVALDRAWLLADIETQRPDIVLVEESWWKPWLDRTPQVAAALAAYRPVATVENTIIMLRRDP